MEALFLRICNMSITAGWVALFVLVLRLLLKKAPKALTVALWGLVGLRLCLPISLPNVWSLIPSAQTIPEEILFAQAPMVQTGIPVLDQAVNPILVESLTPDPTASVNPMQVVAIVASWVWAAGVILMLCYMAWSYWRVRRGVKEAAPEQGRLWVCDRIDTPFILGVFRPRIYLPSDMSVEDREFVVAHEQAHIKRGDHLWKPIGFALLAVHWFNPLLWIGYLLLCRDIEMACDEKVLKEKGLGIKMEYSQALIRCSIPRKSIAACPLAFGEVGVKERVKGVLHYKKPAFWLVLTGVLALAIAAVCLLTDPAETQGTGADYLAYPRLIGLPLDEALEELDIQQEDTQEFPRGCWDLPKKTEIAGGEYEIRLKTSPVEEEDCVWAVQYNRIMGPQSQEAAAAAEAALRMLTEQHGQPQKNSFSEEETAGGAQWTLEPDPGLRGIMDEWEVIGRGDASYLLSLSLVQTDDTGEYWLQIEYGLQIVANPTRWEPSTHRRVSTAIGKPFDQMEQYLGGAAERMTPLPHGVYQYPSLADMEGNLFSLLLGFDTTSEGMELYSATYVLELGNDTPEAAGIAAHIIRRQRERYGACARDNLGDLQDGKLKTGTITWDLTEVADEPTHWIFRKEEANIAAYLQQLEQKYGEAWYYLDLEIQEEDGAYSLCLRFHVQAH